MIRIDHVTKRFGRTVAVNDATLDLPAGDSLALWGANGAGKTTLIRCVLGLLRFHGTISVGGHDVRRCGKRARLLIGYVPQELGFYDDLGVAEAVKFFGRLRGLTRADAGRTLAEVGLEGHERKSVRELSGGMKQRLALAIALLGDPPVLVLDEVTASLDAVGREEFVLLLERLSGAGRTLLFASHRIEEVAALAKRVAVLDRGAVTRVDSCGDFVAGLGRGFVLHLVISPSDRERAVRSLRVGGFAPRLNGVGVVVAVAPEQKAAPFRVLAEARVPVDDFELVSAGRAAPVARNHEEVRS
jgi:ABC-2 type transport system ATP-binding protein